MQNVCTYELLSWMYHFPFCVTSSILYYMMWLPDDVKVTDVLSFFRLSICILVTTYILKLLSYCSWSNKMALKVIQTQNTHTHTQRFYGPLRFCLGLPGWAGTREVNQSGFTEARDSEWQWHQLCHLQICTWTQTLPLPATQITASKHWRQDGHSELLIIVILAACRIQMSGDMEDSQFTPMVNIETELQHF